MVEQVVQLIPPPIAEQEQLMPLAASAVHEQVTIEQNCVQSVSEKHAVLASQLPSADLVVVETVQPVQSAVMIGIGWGKPADTLPAGLRGCPFGRGTSPKEERTQPSVRTNANVSVIRLTKIGSQAVS